MASPTPIIEASLLLSGSDLALFILWQEKELENAPGYQSIFTAISYSEFGVWRAGRDPSSTDDVAMKLQALHPPEDNLYEAATIYKHPLHPITETIEYCPLCKVNACLKLIDAITQSWVRQGAPRLSRPVKKSAKYRQLRDGWRRARLELARLTSFLDEQSDLEADWDRNFENTNVQESTNSATKALKHAVESVQYPAKVVSRDTKVTSQKDVTKPSKTVRFASDTTNGTHRNKRFFLRNSLEYLEGNHACRAGYEWMDSSLMRNYLFTLAQMKTYVVKFDGTEDANSKVEVDLDSLTHEGLAHSHALWTQIRAYWNYFFTNKFNHDRKGLKKELEQAESIVLLLCSTTMELIGMKVGKKKEEKKSAGVLIAAESIAWTSFKDCV